MAPLSNLLGADSPVRFSGERRHSGSGLYESWSPGEHSPSRSGGDQHGSQDRSSGEEGAHGPEHGVRGPRVSSDERSQSDQRGSAKSGGEDEEELMMAEDDQDQ